jgi:hypothetical protein
MRVWAKGQNFPFLMSFLGFLPLPGGLAGFAAQQGRLCLPGMGRD